MKAGLELYPDNICWQTDFPHPTCQHPGLSDGRAQHPADYVDQTLGDLPESLLRRVLHDNAARIYQLD